MKEYIKKKIIITGGRGFIGSKLVDFFSNIDCSLVIIDRSKKSVWKPKGSKANIEYKKIDLLNIKDLKKTTIFNKASYIFHLAGSEINYDRDIYEDYRLNTLSLLNLLLTCKNLNVRPKIINASAAMIYGLTKDLPVNENNINNPPSFWALHKLYSEEYLRYFSKNYGFSTISLRLSNVYGPINRLDYFNKMILNKIIFLAYTNNIIYYFKNYKCIRDFIYIDDVIQAFLLTCKIDKKYFDGRHFVIGSGEGKKIIDVWKRIGSLVGNVAIKEKLDINVNLAEKRNFYSNSYKFKKLTSWDSNINLEEGIEKTLEFIKKNINKIS